MCQENKDYTDCVIKIDEEELRAHRLVLGSVSPFLKLVFSDIHYHSHRRANTQPISTIKNIH